jgi:hypothetical protein
VVNERCEKHQRGSWQELVIQQGGLVKTKLMRILTITSISVLALVLILGGGSIVYGKGRGLSPSRYRALPAPVRAVADVARADLAAELGVEVDRIAVLGVDPVNFSDSSLGVIEPGKRYVEAATPGYTVRFSASGKTYTYHGSGDRIVPVPAGEESAAVVQRLLRSSVSDLQDRLNVGLHEVVVQSVGATEFPDGSLGAPEPNVPYPLVPTPVYAILLHAKGVVYRYWAAGDRSVYIGSFPEPDRAVTVYLHRSLDAQAEQCGMVYPVARPVPVTAEASSMVALGQLFAGPTASETAQGYVSPFSEATADMVMGIRVEGRTAYVDVADVFPAMLADGDCSRQAFLAEVEATLKEVLPVEWVVYTIEGDPQAFCQWMGWCE